jgi:hypothetical protein
MSCPRLSDPLTMTVWIEEGREIVYSLVEARC